jgi:hypothetical protein
MDINSKKDINIKLILCEATGGYERTLIKELQAQNIPVFVEHANKIRTSKRRAIPTIVRFLSDFFDTLSKIVINDGSL